MQYNKRERFGSRMQPCCCAYLAHGHEYVIERFGKFDSIDSSGCRWLCCCIHSIKYMVDTRELCLTVPHGEGYTADNVSVRVAANIYVKFSNSEKAAQGASEPLRCIREFAKAAVRTAIGKMELNHIFENREKINEEVCVVMNSGVCEWGCHILRFEITALEPADQAVKASLHKQAAAEREKTETILRAEAHREQIIRYAEAKLYADQKGADAYELKFKLEGEGDKYRIMARAEAETESIKMISEALQAEGGENSRKTRLTEAQLKQFGILTSKCTSILVPKEAGGFSGAIAVGEKLFHKS